MRKKVINTGSVNPEDFVLDESLEKEITEQAKTFDFEIKDENGYTPKNTNIYVKVGEKAEFVMIPHQDKNGNLTTKPYVLKMHGLTLYTKEGKQYFPKEMCISGIEVDGQPQTEIGNCPLCQVALNGNKSVTEAKHYLFLLVLDLRGTRQKDGSFDTSTPQIGFWRISTSLYKTIRQLESEMPTFNKIILKVSKEDKQNTIVNVKFIRQTDGSFKPAYYNGDIPVLPNFAKLYATPKPYEYYLDLVKRATKTN